MNSQEKLNLLTKEAEALRIAKEDFVPFSYTLFGFPRKVFIYSKPLPLNYRNNELFSEQAYTVGKVGELNGLSNLVFPNIQELMGITYSDELKEVRKKFPDSFGTWTRIMAQRKEESQFFAGEVLKTFFEYKTMLEPAEEVVIYPTKETSPEYCPTGDYVTQTKFVIGPGTQIEMCNDNGLFDTIDGLVPTEKEVEGSSKESKNMWWGLLSPNSKKIVRATIYQNSTNFDLNPTVTRFAGKPFTPVVSLDEPK